MLTITDNGIITLTRGDHVKLPLFINQGTKMHPIRYSLKYHPRSELYLGIMEPSQTFENSLVRKKFTNFFNITYNTIMYDF